jgi:hypothetical protein
MCDWGISLEIQSKGIRWRNIRTPWLLGSFCIVGSIPLQMHTPSLPVPEQRFVRAWDVFLP